VVVAHEAAHVAQGAAAAKLTWHVRDAARSVTEMFGFGLAGLASQAEYELHVSADNQTGSPLYIIALQARLDPRRPLLERRGFAVIEIPPRPGYHTYSGRFTTSQIQGIGVLLTLAYNGEALPAEAYFDDFRLTRIGPARP